MNKGCLRMYSIDKNGKEHVLHFAPKTRFSRPGVIILIRPSDYYIDAVETLEVLVLSPEYFDFLAENQPSVIAKRNVLLHERIAVYKKELRNY